MNLVTPWQGQSRSDVFRWFLIFKVYFFYSRTDIFFFYVRICIVLVIHYDIQPFLEQKYNNDSDFFGGDKKIHIFV